MVSMISKILVISMIPVISRTSTTSMVSIITMISTITTTRITPIILRIEVSARRASRGRRRVPKHLSSHSRYRPPCTLTMAAGCAPPERIRITTGGRPPPSHLGIRGPQLSVMLKRAPESETKLCYQPNSATNYHIEYEAVVCDAIFARTFVICSLSVFTRVSMSVTSA